MKSAPKIIFAGAVLCCLAFAECRTLQAQISTNIGDLFDKPPGPTVTYSMPGPHGIELFNGKNFDGFTFCMNNNADPMKTWSITNGVIHCNGSAIGYLRTKQSYSNYVVTVVWRFLKVTPKANNTGVLVHMQLPDKVWPVCVQNQGKSGRQGDLFVMMGAECKEHKGMDRNTPVAFTGPSNEHPVGEWDTNVTVCAGNDVKAIINGKLLNEITECTVSSGFVGIQSEGADFEIRKMYLEPSIERLNLNGTRVFMIHGFAVSVRPNGYWPVAAEIFVEPVRFEEVSQKSEDITRIIKSRLAGLEKEDIWLHSDQLNQKILVEANNLFQGNPIRYVLLSGDVK